MPNTITKQTRKRCVECDRGALWSNWFCPACGGRLVLDEPEGFEPTPGVNRVLTVINDRQEDLIIHVLPGETIRVQPGQILNIPVAQDQNSLFRAMPGGSWKIGARMYAESSQDVKDFLER